MMDTMLIAVWAGLFSLLICQVLCSGLLEIKTAFMPEECQPYAARRAVHGDSMEVHFHATIYSTTREGNDGEVIDSTIGSRPYAFTLGSTGLLRGWDEALVFDHHAFIHLSKHGFY